MICISGFILFNGIGQKLCAEHHESKRRFNSFLKKTLYKNGSTRHVRRTVDRTTERYPEDHSFHCDVRPVSNGELLISRSILSGPLDYEIKRFACMCFYHVFIDFKKAFDRVWHEALWATIRKYNINASIIRAIENLYDKAQSAVLFNGSTGEWFRLHSTIKFP